jgi:hypothetical protein
MRVTAEEMSYLFVPDTLNFQSIDAKKWVFGQRQYKGYN